MKIQKIFFSSVLALFSIPFAVQAEPPQVFHLDNGMKVIVREDHRAPVAVNMVWYQVGSMDETSGTTGVAHVLEHMMFKGTEKFPEGSLSKTVARLGGKDNAFTNTDYTGYYQQVPARNLEKMVEMEADRMNGLLFRKEDFEKEIKVVQEERRWRTDDKPEGLLVEALRATAFTAHPYHCPVVGWMDDLQNMTLEDAAAWYRKWYAPNNATMVVVGDVKAQDVRALAEKYFGGLPRKPVVRGKPQVEPVQRGIRRVTVNAPAENPTVVLAYKAPPLRDVEKDDDVYALQVLSSVLDGYENARLQSALVRKEKVALEVGTEYTALARGPSLFVLSAVPANGVSVDELEKRLRQSVAEIAKKGVSPEELQRVKTQLVASQIYKRDSMFGQALEIGLYEMSGIGCSQADRVIEKLKAVTPEQVRQVAGRYFQEDQLTVAVLTPVALPKQPTQK